MDNLLRGRFGNSQGLFIWPIGSFRHRAELQSLKIKAFAEFLAISADETRYERRALFAAKPSDFNRHQPLENVVIFESG